MRISRYFDMLTTSFSIMENGMEVEQYMKFRNTLTLQVVSECTVPTY
jgi:tryptophan 2,3-dioxygenase